MITWWPTAQVRCPWCIGVGAVAFVDESGIQVRLCQSADELADWHHGGRRPDGDRVAPVPRDRFDPAVEQTARQRGWSFARVRWCVDPGHVWFLHEQDWAKIRRSSGMVNVRGRTRQEPLDEPTTGR